jgi:hypothetical protein
MRTILRIRMGLAPWIRIRIELKSRIRVRIETSVDVNQFICYSG